MIDIHLIRTGLQPKIKQVVAVDLCSYAAAVWVRPDGEEQSQVHGPVVIGSECYRRNSGSAGV